MTTQPPAKPAAKVDTDKPILMDEPQISETALMEKFPRVTLEWIRAEFANPESKFNSAEEVIEHLIKEVGIQRHFVVAAVKLVESEVAAKAQQAIDEAAKPK